MRGLAARRSRRTYALAVAVLISFVMGAPSTTASSSQRPSRILYTVLDLSNGVERILSVRPDGTRRRPLAGHTFFPEAQWSPDGRKVAYVNSQRNVVIMNADGSNKTQLSFGRDYDASYDSYPVWSPDGTRVAFQRGADTCGVKVIAKSLDGSSRVVVTDNSSGQEGGEPPHWPVSWSPDGSRISYVRYDVCTGGPPPGFNIFTIFTASSLDGSDETKVTDNAAQPLWSPVNNTLAYTTGGTLVVSKEDGSDRTVVANGNAFAYEWSPSGRRIAYSTGNFWMGNSPCGSVHVVRRDGSNGRRVTPRRLCTGEVSWSPLGRRLAFAARVDGASSRDWDLYRVRPDSTHLKRLTFAPRTVLAVDW
jgi:Tol biopolymer transport system component